MEQMRLGHNQRLEEIEVQGDIAESQALFAAVMSFWFGNRTLSKLRGRP